MLAFCSMTNRLLLELFFPLIFAKSRAYNYFIMLLATLFVKFLISCDFLKPECPVYSSFGTWLLTLLWLSRPSLDCFQPTNDFWCSSMHENIWAH